MRQTLAILLIGLLLLSGGGVAGSQAEMEKVDLLLVDETQTLQASILVQILAQALKNTGLFQLEAKWANVQSSFDDPLGSNSTGEQYEMILIVPRGLEDGSLRQLWIATRPITHQTRWEILAGIQAIQALIEQGSQGQLQAVGVMEDLIPAWFAAIFARNGWLK